MRLRICKKCGAPYETDRPNTYLCPACSLQAKRDSVIRDRTCKSCGTTFPGGPRAWYCPDCRKERQRAAEKRYKSNGASRPIGSTDICTRCGAEYTVAGGRQRYCPSCADEAVKESVRPHKRAYNRDRAEELNAHKAEMRTDRKVCTICGAVFDADTPTVTCSPECAKKLHSLRQARADFKRGKRKTAPKDQNPK